MQDSKVLINFTDLIIVNFPIIIFQSINYIPIDLKELGHHYILSFRPQIIYFQQIPAAFSLSFLKFISFLFHWLRTFIPGKLILKMANLRNVHRNLQIIRECPKFLSLKYSCFIRTSDLVYKYIDKIYFQLKNRA